MSNISIRYGSQTGNTKKLAEGIAKTLHVEAKDLSHGIEEYTDILFLGGALYAYGMSEEMKTFIRSLDSKQIGKVVLFTNSALSKSITNKMRKELEAVGCHVDAQSFYCKGSFSLMNKGRPNQDDIKAAQAFAQEVVKGQ